LRYDVIDDFPGQETAIPSLPAAEDLPRALVIENDSAHARVCVQALARLGMRADVVWTREDALEVLSTADPVAFLYVDARTLGKPSSTVEAELCARLPATPHVVASGEIAEVLASEGVVICKPFTVDQFKSAFEEAHRDEATRRILHEAAEAVRSLTTAESAPAMEFSLSA